MVSPKARFTNSSERSGRSLAPPRASKDFDEILMEVANKFEKADNKGEKAIGVPHQSLIFW